MLDVTNKYFEQKETAMCLMQIIKTQNNKQTFYKVQ